MAQEIYSDLGNTIVFELKSALKERKQGDPSITQYFNDLTNLWQELDLFQEVKWNCAEDGQKYKQMMEKERVFDFLHGLNKELDEVRGRVLWFKPFPEIREAFAEVRREEARKRVMLRGTRNAAPEDSSQNSTLVTKRNFPQYNGDQRGFRRNEWPWCDHCQRPGHTKEICWKLHGKPANWKPRRQTDGRGFQVITEEEKTEKGGSAFSKEQMEQLQAMFNQTQVQSMAQTIPNCSLAQTGDYQSAFTIKSETKNPCIIDSGASDHMTGCNSHFSTYTPCSGNLKIKIADGSLSLVAGKGTIFISENIKLQSVLHVPKLTCNLISVSKLSKDLTCIAKFSSSQCEFQDLSSGKTNRQC
ncbi:LOW QUALITY PROTEIN: hypothetical protein TorRG33x02_054880 [Trema orientale]|uniref:Retrovirus-related Pol polyprotein from transposon TNT 1-94-like beta-barrel domain-containing protein n=1 Tax=Trema orientale TaxID=63057 RepID=A0A2P5FMA2_TREOI|nr:LOW QUALITY PROTEIN: hypothetical protein TorRG33x02_054880 [Trema orientale]